ncbi:MAG: hypothetical protein ABIO70_36215 [Pseudomonadota bacterium]
MSTLPDPRFLQEAARAHRARAGALVALAKAVGRGAAPPVTKAVAKSLARLQAATIPPTDIAIQGTEAWLAEQERERRQRLAGDLRAACEATEVELLVLQRAPLELRLPPVSVEVDYDADRAIVRFAGDRLLECEVQAAAIMAARERAVRLLEGRGWEPAGFLRLLLHAWRRVAGSEAGWVELVEVLPELALLLQPRAFRRDPSGRNFKPYPRVQLAYDLWRLRRDRSLAVDGWRLSLGPATGDSTRDKSRVLRLEDAHGQGQYHLTLRFVPEARP